MFQTLDVFGIHVLKDWQLYSTRHQYKEKSFPIVLDKVSGLIDNRVIQLIIV